MTLYDNGETLTEERWHSLYMYDVTKEFTVRRGVLLYCDVILWDITIIRGVSSLGSNKTKCKYVVLEEDLFTREIWHELAYVQHFEIQNLRINLIWF
jgi:hypothetical protein